MTIRSGRRRSSAAAILELTDTELPEGTLASAWENLTFTVDPIAQLAGDVGRPMPRSSACSIRSTSTASTT